MAQHQIASPLPGVFYRSPAPGEPPFVAEGEHVEAGATLGLVEIMKQFGEIKADVAGTVAFTVEDGATLATGDIVTTVDIA